MPKKRKTRQQKKILKLKRELEKERRRTPPLTVEKTVMDKPASKGKKISKEKKVNYQPEYDEGLIKKDLLKTFFLSFFFFALIFVFYLKF